MHLKSDVTNHLQNVTNQAISLGGHGTGWLYVETLLPCSAHNVITQ